MTVSSATLLPPTWWLMCCLDRLTPLPNADYRPNALDSPTWTDVYHRTAIAFIGDCSDIAGLVNKAVLPGQPASGFCASAMNH